MPASSSEDPQSGPTDLTPIAHESKVLSDSGVRISHFPPMIKHTVNRPHSSVLAIVALEKAIQCGKGKNLQNGVVLENFLDHWGIINYCAFAPNREHRSDGSYLKEDSNGEVHVPSAALKSIDSLIRFDKPKCRHKAADVYPSLSCHDGEESDLDSRIRERLSENRCNCCSCPLPIVYYQSQKERRQYFGQYGKVLKVSISRTAAGAIQHFANNTCSVYITYPKEEEAVRCIQSVHGFTLDGRSLRACFGTTKYCHAWLRNVSCSNPDCLYLHEIGTEEDSFTKDGIISAYTRLPL
ncbi:SWI/SNF complex subunit SWI3C [Camellia lanceoleosa]|uniref:SWI/SNF complex subunit SWI3C n=1 Tax=Camellia lanceoleosa TaxID=1840588 RepID=A0ACC0IGG0_9ERIC|nr:SWI/SNF complex subunit SWI3C [Camellia lanceoleosa]